MPDPAYQPLTSLHALVQTRLKLDARCWRAFYYVRRALQSHLGFFPSRSLAMSELLMDLERSVALMAEARKLEEADGTDEIPEMYHPRTRPGGPAYELEGDYPPIQPLIDNDYGRQDWRA